MDEDKTEKEEMKETLDQILGLSPYFSKKELETLANDACLTYDGCVGCKASDLCSKMPSFEVTEWAENELLVRRRKYK